MRTKLLWDSWFSWGAATEIAGGSRLTVALSKLKFGSSEGSSLGTQGEGGRGEGAKPWLSLRFSHVQGLLQKQPSCSYWVAKVQYSISKGGSWSLTGFESLLPESPILALNFARAPSQPLCTPLHVELGLQIHSFPEQSCERMQIAP